MLIEITNVTIHSGWDKNQYHGISTLIKGGYLDN